MQVKPGLVFGAEILNLTRNVTIGGTSQGRSHIAILHNSVAQRVRNARLEFMGPTNTRRGYRHYKTKAPMRVPALGRYGIHFHMCEEGSDGSLVENVVVTKSKTHAFVPHVSHGVTFRGCIAHDTHLSQFWWDNSHRNAGFQTVNDPTDRTLYENCVGSLLHEFIGAMPAPDQESIAERMWQGNPTFAMIRGQGNAAKGCVAVGNLGAGFSWPAWSRGMWIFDDNVAHNLDGNGGTVWHNTDANHQIVRFVSYHNGHSGLKHGAYHNNYNYRDCTFYGNRRGGIVLFANTRREPSRLLFKDCYVDSAGMTEHALIGDQHHHGLFSPESLPVLFENCDFVGGTVSGVGHIQNPNFITTCLWDFVNCRYQTREFQMGTVSPKVRWRVQDAARGSKLLVPKSSDTAGTYNSTWEAKVSSVAPFA